MSTRTVCGHCRRRTVRDREKRSRSAERAATRAGKWRERFRSRSTDADLISEASHERFAQRKLVESNPFVGLMRLLNVPVPADDRGDPGVVEQRRFGAE